MQLTLYSDYSLRVLLYLCHMPKKTATIVEIAHFYKISKNHLVKVVHHLAHSGYIKTLQGKGGGLRLIDTSLNHTLAEILKKTESHFYLVECFNPANDHCMISPHCSLKNILHQASKAFFQVLAHYSLADLNQPQLTQQISHFLNSKKLNSKKLDDGLTPQLNNEFGIVINKDNKKMKGNLASIKIEQGD